MPPVITWHMPELVTAHGIHRYSGENVTHSSAMQCVILTILTVCVPAELHAEVAEPGGLCGEHGCLDASHPEACHRAVLVSCSVALLYHLHELKLQ